MSPERGGTEVRLEGNGGAGKAVGGRVVYLEREGGSAGAACREASCSGGVAFT